MSNELFEITVDGTPHSGAYGSKVEAERALKAVQDGNPGKKVEVRQRALDANAAGGRYQGDGSNNPNYVANTMADQGLGNIQAGDGTIGGTQGLAQGIVPGPGGVANNGEGPIQPKPMVEGKSPVAADKTSTVEPETKPSGSGKK